MVCKSSLVFRGHGIDPGFDIFHTGVWFHIVLFLVEVDEVELTRLLWAISGPMLSAPATVAWCVCARGLAGAEIILPSVRHSTSGVVAASPSAKAVWGPSPIQVHRDWDVGHGARGVGRVILVIPPIVLLETSSSLIIVVS